MTVDSKESPHLSVFTTLVDLYCQVKAHKLIDALFPDRLSPVASLYWLMGLQGSGPEPTVN